VQSAALTGIGVAAGSRPAGFRYGTGGAARVYFVGAGDGAIHELGYTPAAAGRAAAAEGRDRGGVPRPGLPEAALVLAPGSLGPVVQGAARPGLRAGDRVLITISVPREISQRAQVRIRNHKGPVAALL
jgi:hypothetical protein